MRKPCVLSHRIAGFSLIEVLISTLVLSFGIIGTLKMQLNSIHISQQSNFYSTAMELASEMAEIVRSNSAFTQAEFTQACHNTNCSSNELVSIDISEWLQRVDAAIPNARTAICRDSAPWDNNSNALTWDCASSGASSSVVIKLGWSEQNDTERYPPPRIAIAVTPLATPF